MTLDLVQVAEQLPALMERLMADRAERVARVRAALITLGALAAEPELLATRLRDAATKWPLALPLHEAVDRGYPPASSPPFYTVIATDGSHIDVDRHAPVQCYVLNLGWVAIRYGDDPAAELTAQAELQPVASALLVHDEEDASADHPLQGETLSLLRGVRELSRLSGLVVAERGGQPLLALLDGNLGLWNVDQAQIPASLRRRLIEGEGGMLPALNALRDAAERRPLAFAAYTSRAGSAEVVHTLRVGVCPLEHVACTRCPRLDDGARPCDRVGLTSDADLFWDLLRPGERSAVFLVHSRAFLRATGAAEHWFVREEHAVAFFYLRLTDEVARVELPEWMATPERLAALHAMVLDQCERGPGYPVALQEAHEAAVISMVDRQAFAALLERELAGHDIPVRGSAKSASKRVRGI